MVAGCLHGERCKAANCPFEHSGPVAKEASGPRGRGRGHGGRGRSHGGRGGGGRGRGGRGRGGSQAPKKAPSDLAPKKDTAPSENPKRRYPNKEPSKPKKFPSTTGSSARGPVTPRHKSKPKQSGNRCEFPKNCANYSCSHGHDKNRMTTCPVKHRLPEEIASCPNLHKEENSPNHKSILKTFKLCKKNKTIQPCLIRVISTWNNYQTDIIYRRMELNKVPSHLRTLRLGEIQDMMEILSTFINTAHSMIPKEINEATEEDCERISRLSYRLRPFNYAEQEQKNENKKKKSKQEKEYVKEFRRPLPALAHFTEIRDALNADVLIVSGETGSGKSTQVPQYLADIFPDRLIVCTQPRPLAARSLADRVEFEFHPNKDYPISTRDQRSVGYETGRSKTVSGSRIMFYTENQLLQKLNGPGSQQFLDQCAVIMVDEAHERTLPTDILLGRLQQQLSSFNNHIKVVITSATIDKEKFSRFFGADLLVKSVDILGRSYPISIRYKEPVVANSTREIAVSEAIRLSRSSNSGNVLVFMSGVGDVKRSVFLWSKAEGHQGPPYPSDGSA